MLGGGFRSGVFDGVPFGEPFRAFAKEFLCSNGAIYPVFISSVPVFHHSNIWCLGKVGFRWHVGDASWPFEKTRDNVEPVIPSVGEKELRSCVVPVSMHAPVCVECSISLGHCNGSGIRGISLEEVIPCLHIFGDVRWCGLGHVGNGMLEVCVGFRRRWARCLLLSETSQESQHGVCAVLCRKTCRLSTENQRKIQNSSSEALFGSGTVFVDGSQSQAQMGVLVRPVVVRLGQSAC